MKHKLFFVLALVFSTGLFAQSLNEVDLQSVNLNGMKLYFSTPTNAKAALGQPTKIQTYQTVSQNAPYDGIYPYASIDPYGAVYGFYPYGGVWSYNDYYPYYSNVASPYYEVYSTEIMAYPNLVMYFTEQTEGAPQYLSSINLYGQQYSLNCPAGAIKVNDNVSKLQKMFPESYATALKRHKDANGTSFPRDFKVIVKAKQGSGMTSEHARIIFAVSQTGTIQAIQVRLN